MSQVEDLGARVRELDSTLPTAEVDSAAGCLESAYVRLTQALRDSRVSAGDGDLLKARQHVTRARRRLRAASTRLNEYLVAIGVPAATGNAGAQIASRSGAVACAAGTVEWWRSRVNFLTEGESKTEPGEIAVPKLFADLVDHARRGDRDKYRQLLLTAGPQAGAKLPGLAWPMINALAVEVLGRAATAEDDGQLRKHTRDCVADLLPKLPDDVAPAQWRGACSLPHRDAPSADAADREAAERWRPVDSAAVGPALAAGLLRARAQNRKDA